MPRRARRIGRRVAATAAITAAKAFGLLPVSLANIIAIRAARVLFLLVPRPLRTAVDNIEQAYGDSISPAEKKRILREAVDNLAIVAAEFARSPGIAKRGLEGHVRVIGQEHVDPDRGAMFIGAHLGNWELVGVAMFLSLKRDIAAIARPLDDRLLNDYVNGVRTAPGIHTIMKDGAGAKLIPMLRDKWLVGALIDQCPTDNAVPVTFFGRPCWGTIAPVMVAVRAKAPVHPLSLTRNSDGAYTLELYPAIEFQKTGDLLGDLQMNAQRCQDAIEMMVRKNPGQWLWLHRRWKPRPRLEEEWASRCARQKQKSETGAPADVPMA